MTRYMRPLICFLLLTVTGCTKQAPTPVPTPPHSPALHITLDISPNPPRSLDLTTFTIHLTDAHGKPISGASVLTELTMPSMTMPENQFEAKPTVPGVYLGIGRFTMSGDWQATVTVMHGTNKTLQTFPVSVN